ncbi:MAG: DUF5119 domain-containing protein [Bacteroidales bacterium]
MIHRYLSKALCLISMINIFVSCSFDELYYETLNYCHIRLNIDWSKTKFRLNGASVYVYHKNGSLYKALPPFSNPYIIDLALPQGEYNLVLHNNTPYELPNMNFRGWEDSELFRAEPRGADKYMYGHNVVSEPEDLGLAHLFNIEVTKAMIDYNPLMERSTGSKIYEEFMLLAEPVISEIEVSVHISGLHNAAGAPLSELTNLAGGLKMMSKELHEEVVDHRFVLNNRLFDSGSDKNGRIMKTLRCFGFLPKTNLRNILKMNFMLVNGAPYNISADITDKIEKMSELKYRVALSCKLPDVQNESGGDSGFNPDVEGWEDIEVDVPMY